jgi:hypothetical protein
MTKKNEINFRSSTRFNDTGEGTYLKAFIYVDVLDISRNKMEMDP